jgi:hypothetical protein
LFHDSIFKFLTSKKETISFSVAVLLYMISFADIRTKYVALLSLTNDFEKMVLALMQSSRRFASISRF